MAGFSAAVRLQDSNMQLKGKNPMQRMDLIRACLQSVYRSEKWLFVALALVVGVCAILFSKADAASVAASCTFAGFLLASVIFRGKPPVFYVLTGLALFVYAAALQLDVWYAELFIAYPLLLMYALLMPNPLYMLVAALAVGLHLYTVTDDSEPFARIAHLVFFSFIALANILLASYIKHLEQERNEYRHLSGIDSLTGLASLQQTLQFGQRLLDDGRTVRVLLIDLNFFKQINDTYGHMIGNRVIMLVADYLREMIRDVNGIAGRLGGDEFVVIVEDAPRFENMRQKLLDELNGKSFIPDDGLPPVSLSFSVGVAVSSTEETVHIEELLHGADLNMYEYKLQHKLPAYLGKTADLIEHNPAPICTFDRKGKLLAINPAVSGLLGYSAQELTRRQFVALIHPQDRLKALTSFQEAMEGNSVHLELRLIHKEGYTVEVDVTNIPIIADLQIVGIYGVAKDVTDRKKSEELLRNSDRLAVMGQLAAGLAHEIRNPLTALKGFIQLLQSSPKENKSYYPIMLTELDRINLILNEFLLLSKPRPTLFGDTDIRVVIRHVVTLLDTQAILSKVRIVIVEKEDLPVIRCDENQMKQVFVNVLKNAIEAMPDGGEVTVTTLLSEQDVVVRVQDEGDGISDELISRIGQPFFTTKDKGTGLGLMVCNNIMENHGGRLTIRSVPGKGTTVEVELPIREGAAQEDRLVRV
ncbi:MAG: two-component sensor histidine kinase [Paenibacillus sp.]|nr:two-component sensor histidine kinase [Paenibacillus sp.]